MPNETEIALERSDPRLDAPLPLRPAAGLAPRKDGRLLAPTEVISLYRSIETGLGDLPSRAVEFVSCYSGEGTTTVAWELALIVAETLAKRTLFIDVTQPPSMPRGSLKASLLDVAYGRASIDDAVVGAGPPLLGYTALSIEAGAKDGLLAHLDRLKEVVDGLRPHFDFIILNSSNALGHANSVGLGRVVDGIVLVVEAERTRAPVTQQVLQVFEASGATVLGVVLNKRKYHIPSWIYRWL